MKKKLFTYCLSLVATLSANAQNRSPGVGRSIQNLQQAFDQSRYVQSRLTNQEDRERLTFSNNKIQETIRILQNLGSGGHPPPFPGNRVEFYKSDSCHNELVAVVSPATDCDSLAKSRVWAIKADGKCYDIDDGNGDQVCRRFRAMGPAATLIYKSDSCSSSLVAAVDASTDCSSLQGTRAWAISRNGQCQDISDLNGDVACERFR